MHSWPRRSIASFLRRRGEAGPGLIYSRRLQVAVNSGLRVIPSAGDPVVRAFHLKRKSTDRADFLGFGQMGLFDAQFVMQAVEGRSVLEAFPPIPNPASVKPAKSRLTQP